MTDDAGQELPQRLRAAKLTQAEYQKTEAERQIKLSEAAELEDDPAAADDRAKGARSGDKT